MVKNQTLLNSLLNGDFEKLKADLEANCREDALKVNGKTKNKLSILKRLNNENSELEKIHNKAIICKSGFAFMNNYMILFSNSDFGYENKTQDDTIEIDNHFVTPYENGYNQFMEITLTDEMVADIRVKAKEKRNKYDRIKPYIIQYKDGREKATRENCIGIDPKKLIDIIDFTDSYTLRVIKYNAPIWLEGNIEKGMVLPVYIHSDKDIIPNVKFETLTAK